MILNEPLILRILLIPEIPDENIVRQDVLIRYQLVSEVSEVSRYQRYHPVSPGCGKAGMIR
jgi:hypothetical protein